MKQRSAKIGSLLLAILFLCNLVSSVHAKRLPVRIYTSADGLGSSFVNYLARDSRGFMWFCTRDGLSRFDGSQFVTYQIGEQNSQPGVENIFEASDGSYWITTTAGTYRFDPKQIYAQDGGVPTLRAEHVFDHRGVVYEDRNGNLWLGADALYKIEMIDGKYTATDADLAIPLPPGAGLVIASLDESADGSLWIGTTVGYVRQLPTGQRVFYPDPEKRLIPGGSLRILLDERGFVWISLLNKLYVLRPDPLDTISANQALIVRDLAPTKTFDLSPGDSVPLPQTEGELFEFRNPVLINNRYGKELWQTSDESVWISGEDILLEFTNGKLNVHTSADGLPSVMGDMAEDSAGNLWIAGQSSLARLNRNGLVGFGKEDGTGSDRILSVFEGSNGAIYVSTTDSNVAAFDGTAFRNARPALGGNTSHLWTSRTAMQDSRGDWWVLTTNKLFRLAGAQDIALLAGRDPTAVYGSENGLVSDGIFQIFEDHQGNVWVSTRGTDAALNGLSMLRPGDKSFTPMSGRNGLPSRTSASSFAVDTNGHLWVGLFEGGIFRFDGTMFHELKMAEAENTLITDLHFDSQGRLWITSASSGVTQVTDPLSERPTSARYTNLNGLSSNNVRTVTEDRFGRIYFGTARGVDRLSPDTGRVRQFTVAHGLPADFVSDSTQDSQGNVWFATNSGVARLAPVPDEIPETPKVWLGGMSVGGDLYPLSELGADDVKIDDLAHWQNNLQIEFFGIDFHAGEALRYEYKLEGANADWSRPDTDRSVTFANLRPGSYRFLVRGVSSVGAASESPAVVNFVILPPIWQRWWFVLMTAIAVAAIVTGLYRYRITNLRRVNRALSEAKLAEERLRRSREERLAELEQVRSRIATDLHDDIGASLTQIAILSEVAQTNVGNGNGSAIEPLTRITDVSNELVGTMSDIVWSINPAKDHLSDLTQRMRRFASDVLSPRGVKFTFTTPGSEGEIVLNTNVRREVFLIFKESVNNIAKHSKATAVSISLELDGADLVFGIDDDGVGFSADSEQSSSGHGIMSMSRRAREMGGQLKIVSLPGKGTSVKLRLPIEQTLAA